ncbi:MAG: non-heme iron oxygenase ferredoxin subunit [Methanobacteriaceae archaeon]|nr:non-heme iron oxygenase ferredoxin subunit [Methanobacteriaceae archaeon]
MELMEICKTNDLNEGEMKKVIAGDMDVLIARIKGEFFAVENKCPHMGGDLSKGTLEGSVITCPLHHSQFDLTTGQVILWTDFTGLKASISKLFKSPRPLKTYQVIIEGDQVLLKI